MSPCSGNNKTEKKEIPTEISNVIESFVCDIYGQSHCRLRTAVAIIVRQNLGEFWEDLELDFKLFLFVDSCSAYIVLQKSE